MSQNHGRVLPGDYLRLFFAVRAPTEISPLLIDLQKQLRGDWKPVQPDQFHLTLVFMGQTLPSELKTVEEVGAKIAARTAPFSIQLTHTDCFPGRRNPRVLVVHALSEGLKQLTLNLRAGLAGLVDFDPKPFKGHLTLARAKGPNVHFLDSTLNKEWRIVTLELVRSTLTGTKAEHAVLQSFPLKPSLS